MVLRRWSVDLERTVRELQGQPCIALEHMPPAKQQIAYTRSFGHAVSTLADLGEAMTEFASRAAQKLRSQGALTPQLLCFIRTSPFSQQAQYSRSISVPLRRPSADTGVLVAAALAGLACIYRPGYAYAKAGVILPDLQSAAVQQSELGFDATLARLQERSQLMRSLDDLNQRYGRGTVSLASAGLAGGRRAWTMKQERRSPGYTTCWADMPVARA